MPRGKAKGTDQTTLQMALVGYEVERQRIEEKIQEIRTQLGHTQGRFQGAGAAAGNETASKRRVLSAAARKRIGAAQRKRWAAHRKKVAAEGKG